ncbi:unnamed protein product [Pleuronectes platessa]|uniref:Epidermal growth factor receptor substrate 15-like 1 n=1 Tax=Pleuronectes platessa TaxID=8262 RepID=A0A9N7VRD2_PLEPL|nr:unnamed protein product [Pleuronectes platessa]
MLVVLIKQSDSLVHAQFLRSAARLQAEAHRGRGPPHERRFPKRPVAEVPRLGEQSALLSTRAGDIGVPHAQRFSGGGSIPRCASRRQWCGVRSFSGRVGRCPSPVRKAGRCARDGYGGRRQSDSGYACRAPSRRSPQLRRRLGNPPFVRGPFPGGAQSRLAPSTLTENWCGRRESDCLIKTTASRRPTARSKLSQIQDSQQEVSKSIEQYNSSLNGTHGGSMTNLADMSEGFSDRENGGFPAMVRAAQEDPFKVKPSVFNSQPQELPTDPFHSEDPFITDPFKGDPFQNDPFAKQPPTSTDPFGGDPFKETDPFKTSSEDFFKKTTKIDPFSTTDPFNKSATLPSKVLVNQNQASHFTSNDPFSSSNPKPRGADLFGALDPFGSSSFSSSSNSSAGFADFSHMSKPRDPFEGRASWLPDYQKSVFVDDPFNRKSDTPALPPKKSVPPRPKPPSGKSTPVSMSGTADPSKPGDPFQPFGSDIIDPFQSKKGLGDPFSGKDPFAPSSSRPEKVKFGNEAQQLEWAKRESERAERERLKRLRQQEQEDLELAIALSKAEMSNA